MNKKEEEFRSFVSKRTKQILEENGSPAKRTISGLIGHGENSLSRMINGKNTPSFLLISDFCDYFGITIAKFFEKDYRNDKTVSDFMNLLTNNFTADDINKLYEFFNNLGAENIKLLLRLFSQYSSKQMTNAEHTQSGKEQI